MATEQQFEDDGSFEHPRHGRPVRPGVATVDLMRHRRDAPNGIMDYLFCELLLHLHAERYGWFSLGLAPLSGVGDRPGASLRERAVHQVYEHLTALFSFKGLRSYEAKFEPVWEERFLVDQDGPSGSHQNCARARSRHAGAFMNRRTCVSVLAGSVLAAPRSRPAARRVPLP